MDDLSAQYRGAGQWSEQLGAAASLLKHLPDSLTMIVREGSRDLVINGGRDRVCYLPDKGVEVVHRATMHRSPGET
jgi:hypothetical protein